MAEVTDLVPALALHRQIEALALLGLDANAVRAQLGELPATPDALVHTAKYAEMWSVAQRLYGLPGLPTALAMAIPFGAFGALDYLAGSAETVAAACESVSLHLSMVAIDVRLQREEIGDGLRVLEVRGVGSMPADALEFTMASIIGRLRYVTRDALCLVAVGLPVQRPEHDPVRTRLYGVPVNYAHPCASCTLDADGWAMNTSSADPFLHATLAAVASQLHLAPRPGSEL